MGKINEEESLENIIEKFLNTLSNNFEKIETRLTEIELLFENHLIFKHSS